MSDGNLVIGRHRDESVILRHPDGTEILITVGQIGRNAANAAGYVRLVFNAPRSIQIIRSELDKGGSA